MVTTMTNSQTVEIDGITYEVRPIEDREPAPDHNHRPAFHTAESDGAHAPACESSGTSPPVEWALNYAGRGWPVLPIRPRSKAPLISNGVKGATTDPDVIRQWWKIYPDAGIGIATGAPGPTVLDIDDVERGAEAIARLNGAPYATTGRGRHYYHVGSDARNIGLTYGDVKGTGGYVLAPPSVHPSGAVYAWGSAPNGTLPALPAWVAEDRAPHVAREGERFEPRENVPVGERHNYLVSLAGWLAHDAEVPDADQIEADLERVGAGWTPPMAAGRNEVRAIAEWAEQAELEGRNRGVQECITTVCTARTPHSETTSGGLKDPDARKDLHNDDAPALGRRAHVILETVPEEPDWLIPGILARGWLVKVAGREKVGKGTLVYHLLGRLELGEPSVFGDATAPTRAVIYSEEPEDAVREKVADSGLREALLIYGHELAGRTWPQKVEALVAATVADGAGVLYVENISRAAGIGDEAGVELARAVELLGERTKAVGIAAICDHHHRKAAGRVEDKSRGGTGTAGATDNNVEVERVGDITSRTRRISSLGRVRATNWVRTIELGEDNRSYHEVDANRTDPKLATLAARDTWTAAEFAEAIERQRTTAQRWLDDCAYVEKVRDGRTVTYRVLRDRLATALDEVPI